MDITATGDFPWAQARWRDLSTSVQSASLSPTGQRALIGARGEIFTVPTDNGDPRNLTRSSGAYDQTPVWSADGSQIAWFSNDGDGYTLKIGSQDGLTEPRVLSIGESKLATVPTWSPDGERIAFVDYRSRLQVVELESGDITTADQGYLIQSLIRPQWSPDSKSLAYAKDFENRFYRIVLWSLQTGETHEITDALANAVFPTWDRDGRHLYFLASTNLGLAADGLNLSSLNADPTYGVYVTVLRDDDPSPFIPESDEEPVAEEEEEEEADPEEEADTDDESEDAVRIDFDRIDRRILSIPMPVGRYGNIIAGPEGTVFVAEQGENSPVSTLHKFSLTDRESSVFARGVRQVSISADGSKLIYNQGGGWNVVGTAAPPEPGQGRLSLTLRAYIDPLVEWQQMFEEVWKYERDFFYDPDTHGADWEAVRDRYGPLIPHIRHRSDLTYVLDAVGGELSVGHSFVGGGDFPAVDTVRVGVLGADLEADQGRWRISRIYTSESWNPGMVAPLDRPGMRVREGHYLLAVDGVSLTANDDPYRLLDGTAGRQTVIQVNDQPNTDGAWTEIVSPLRNENALRMRAWVEDNRRTVDELSGGRLAYVWVPNTTTAGYTSFNRYYFAQQNKAGAVVDERFNGGGSADDYMVDLMTRRLRAAYNNPGAGGPLSLPAGILGPKVLITNERAGSGGDYFPWAFRQLEVGPIVGTRTWGGLVANCAPYLMVDGFRITSPCIGLFHPDEGWIAESIGIPPDIEVFMDAAAVAEGRDPQLERAVQEALRLLEEEGTTRVTTPPFSRPARRPGGRR
jgi:tricorn protease